MQKLKQQAGFSALGGMLVVVALFVVGVAGYFVYQTRSTQPASYSVNVPNKKAASPKPTTQQVASTTATSGPIANSSQYFSIKELGLKFNSAGLPSGLSYSFSLQSGVQQISFGSTQLKSFANARDGGNRCDFGALGVVSWTAQSTSSSSAGPHSNGLVAHVGQYYYEYTHAQNLCSSNASVQAEQNAEMTSLVGDLTTLQPQ